MAEHRQPGSFLVSPIPKDPTQRLFVDGPNGNTEDKADSFFDPEVEDMTRLQMDTSASNTRGISTSDTLAVDARGGHGVLDSRLAKRPRLEAESVAILKCKQLETEVATLRVQLQHKTERHQSELKERDLKLDQMRRQLQYAIAEEEHTRKELKQVTNEASTDKLQLQKKIVELDSKLQFVENSLSEWKEKALDAESELRTMMRQHNLKIQLLTEDLEAARAVPPTPASESQSVLLAKIQMLESQLRDQEMHVDHANTRIASAAATLEAAQETRALKERIHELETQERRLKSELVEMIQSSKQASLYEEKMHQLRMKLNSSEQRSNQAQQTIESLLAQQQALVDLQHYFEPFVRNGPNAEEMKTRPVAAIKQAYKSLQDAHAKLHAEKKAMESEMERVRREQTSLNERRVAAERQAEAHAVLVNELQQQVTTASTALSHSRRANEELVSLLQTYEKGTDEPVDADGAAARLSQLASMLQQITPLLSDVESIQKQAAAPSSIVKKYEAELTTLKQELDVAIGANKKLKSHTEKIERELAIAEKRLGRGEFNPQTTKVVHLAVNPTSEILRAKHGTAELEALRQENANLREQLQQKAPGHTSMLDVTASATKLTTTTSYETVEGQKLLNQRLKEVFRDQIQQYREAVYQLTGYKVDLKKTNGVELLRLRSMYADNEDDELLVRMEPDGALELLESEYCAQINKRVFAYLTTCRSFPAFLATLTLHLFEKQTFQG